MVSSSGVVTISRLRTNSRDQRHGPPAGANVGASCATNRAGTSPQLLDSIILQITLAEYLAARPGWLA